MLRSLPRAPIRALHAMARELTRKNIRACAVILPLCHRRYVNDILVTMPNTEEATGFLQVLNNVLPSLSFTMELEHGGSIPFLGTVLTIKMSWHSNDRSLQKTNLYPEDCCSISKAMSTTDTSFMHCCFFD